MTAWREPLDAAARHARAWLESLPDRPVGPPVDDDRLRRALALPLQEDPLDATRVVDELAVAAATGLVASPGPRYFGFVVGGSHPAALAADWLTSAWDQVAGAYVGSPAAAVVEDAAAAWVLDLLDLPRGASVGFTTGAATANLTALAAARHDALARVGWDVAERGLAGAPPITAVVGDQRHTTVDSALRTLGIGSSQTVGVEVDGQGRMDARAFAEALRSVDAPVIACAQAGNVATGAFDPLRGLAGAAHEHGAWLHVDGAFGLWARAARELAALADGADLADSWAVDAHKWLNVPYDCGIVVVRRRDAHYAAMRKGGAYSMPSRGGLRDAEQWVPEFSRRARATPVYAVLRALGRRGVEDLVSRCCRLARRFAASFDGNPHVEVLNDVVLNQALLAFPTTAADEAFHADVVLESVHRDGTFWAGSTEWGGRRCMRVSISGWATTEGDVDRAAGRLAQIVAGANARWSRPA